MRPNPKILLPAILLGVAVTGCVDDNYDLSDIDTTSRFEVKDLTIPVNIDAITLKDILDIKEDSRIKAVTIDGNEFYALTETGSFDSDPIFIKKISAKAPILSSSSRTFDEITGAGSMLPAATYVYNLTEMGNNFTYDAGKIDESIINVTSVSVSDVVFRVHLASVGIDNIVDRQYFEDMVIELPKGMVATPSVGEYDPATGLWTIDRHNITGSSTDVWVTASKIDLAANGVAVSANHTLIFPGSFKVLSGKLTIVSKVINGTHAIMPAKLGFTADYSLTDLDVTAFSGVIEYKFDGFDIDPVSLSDVPTFLKGDGTVLKLANPQIYLQLNNPVGGDHLSYSAGLMLSSVREDWGVTDYTPLSDISVGYDKGVDGPYNFVLAPQDGSSLSVPDDFAQNLTFIGFPSLSDLLAPPANAKESGLPSQINIKVVNPLVPRQTVNDFKLGVNLPGAEGKYELLAPLALNDGSTIVYTDTEDGWNDEDVDALTITSLSVSLNVTNMLQFDGELTAYPIDVEGKRIPGVTISSSKISAHSTDEPVTITMTGTVQHLDGVIFVARLNSAGREPLAPSESIVLKNIRVKVSGFYDKEL